MKYQVGLSVVITKPERCGVDQFQHAHLQIYLKSNEPNYYSDKEFQRVASVTFQLTVGDERNKNEKWYAGDLVLDKHGVLDSSEMLDKWEYVIKTLKKVKTRWFRCSEDFVQELRKVFHAKEGIYDRRVSKFVFFNEVMPLDVKTYALFVPKPDGRRSCVEHFYCTDMNKAMESAKIFLQEKIPDLSGQYFAEEKASYETALLNPDVELIDEHYPAPSIEDLQPAEIKLGLK